MFSSKLIVPERCSVCLDVQSCPTLRNALDYNLPGSSVLGIFQAEYWSGLPFPPPRDFPNPGTKLAFPALQANSLLLSHHGRPFYTVVIAKACPLQLPHFFFFVLFLSDVFIYFEQKLKSRRRSQNHPLWHLHPLSQNHPLWHLHPFAPPFLEAQKALCIII